MTDSRMIYLPPSISYEIGRITVLVPEGLRADFPLGALAAITRGTRVIGGTVIGLRTDENGLRIDLRPPDDGTRIHRIGQNVYPPISVATVLEP